MKKADRKPNLQQFMAAKVAGIRKAFTLPMRVTIVVRNPASTELEAVFSDDDIDGLITCLQRRRDQVMTAQGPQSVMHAPQGAATVAPAVDEMKELLCSTHEIALRGGADTHWEGLAKSIAKLGIPPITARHYFAEGTSREVIDKHLDALLSRINAAPANGARDEVAQA